MTFYSSTFLKNINLVLVQTTAQYMDLSAAFNTLDHHTLKDLVMFLNGFTSIFKIVTTFWMD